MNNANPVGSPGGLEIVIAWVERIHSGVVDGHLWEPLDDNLRLCYAQMYVYNNGGFRDEKRVAALALRHPSHSEFRQMLEQHVERWRGVYRLLANGIAYLDAPESVGVDMEYVALFESKHSGAFDGPLLANSFITRWVGDEWLIAATARRLPVPGWPPTEREIPGLRADGHY